MRPLNVSSSWHTAHPSRIGPSESTRVRCKGLTPWGQALTSYNVRQYFGERQYFTARDIILPRFSALFPFGTAIAIIIKNNF
jgi:hypothetical protein